MFRLLKGQYRKFKANLTSLDNQPLSRASLIILVFLNIFILTSIFDGLDKHTQQIPSPDEYVPFTCREIIINRGWNLTNRIDNLSVIILAFNRGDYQIKEKRIKHHLLCDPYLTLLHQVRDDKKLLALVDERDKLQREEKDLLRGIENLRGAYDASLLVTIAKRKNWQTNVDNVRNDIQAKLDALNSLRAQVQVLEHKINENAKIRQLWKKIETLQPASREILKSDLRAMNFWYPIKKLGMQLIFLLPLFAIFYIWNNASIRNSRSIQTLVSSHLLVVSFIPIFCKIIESIYYIIPELLLRKFIDLLESLKLVALWNYLVIAIAIMAALALIYTFQKKLFYRDKLMERRIAKGLCQHCGKHLPIGSKACPFCGFVQFKLCNACNRPTLIHGKFCKTCGKQL